MSGSVIVSSNGATCSSAKGTTRMLMDGNLTGHGRGVPPTFHLRNGAHGYGAVTKTLHWLTVWLVSAQFVIGYLMREDDRGRGRGRGHGSGRGRGGEDFD